MEMIMNLPVEELTSKTRYNAISSIYPHLPEDHFSSFSNHYKVGEEREFIAEHNEKNPGKYIKFIIAWSDSN